MYDEYKVYGSYTRSDGRKQVTLYKNKIRTTLSYPKYLMELHLGRQLCPNECIHHIDHDVSNNSLNNLIVISRDEHSREHSLKYRETITVKCCWCGSEFKLTPKQQSYQYRNRNRVKTGPFCSRSCIGKYTRASKQECLV